MEPIAGQVHPPVPPETDSAPSRRHRSASDQVDRDTSSIGASVETANRLAPKARASFGEAQEYPFLRNNLFYYVYVLSFYDRAKDDPRYLEALRFLESKLDARGRVNVERPNHRLADLSFRAVGRPAELATARYREVVKNLEG